MSLDRQSRGLLEVPGSVCFGLAFAAVPVSILAAGLEHQGMLVSVPVHRVLRRIA